MLSLQQKQIYICIEILKYNKEKYVRVLMIPRCKYSRHIRKLSVIYFLKRVAE